jgi:hypothetical protein
MAESQPAAPAKRGPGRPPKVVAEASGSGSGGRKTPVVTKVEADEETNIRVAARKRVVKAEPTEEKPVAATRVARGRTGTTTTTTTTTKTPAATATKARATRKTPTTAPAAIVGGDKDKENTPGSDAGDSGGSDGSEEGGKKVKVSRTTTTRKAASGTTVTEKVKEEMEAPPARGTIMRSTRARTRT